MEMSEIQAARLLLGGDGGAGSGGSRQGPSGPGGHGSASVRYGTVTAVDAEAGTVTVLLDGQAAPITLTDATASTRLKVGDRVKIVKQGQSWVIDLAGGISRALDASVEEAKKQFAADKARMDEHDKAMERYEKDMAAAKDELAGMDGKIDSAVKDAVSKLETPDGGNHIYASADEPTAPEGGFQAGDLWYQTNASGQIAAVKVWNGTVWNGYDLVANSILVAGSVGSTLIADGAVTTSKITSGAVTADQIAANTITGAEIRADSVDVNEIASGDIYCNRLSAVSGSGYVEVKDGTVSMFSSSSDNLFKLGIVNGYASIQSVGNRFIALRGNSTAYGWLKIGDVIEVDGSRPDFGVMRTGWGIRGEYRAWFCLYSNSSGSAGTITLKDDAKSYIALVIIFTPRSDNGNAPMPRSAAIVSSGSGYAALSASYYYEGSGSYTDSRIVQISGKTISTYGTWHGRGWVGESGSVAAAQKSTVRITDVYGLHA